MSETARKLHLQWCVPAFLPVPQQSPRYEALFRVDEWLDPDDFMTPESAANYWSIPEILTEMRWLAQRSAQLASMQDQDYFHQHNGMHGTYLKMQKDFGLLVASIGFQLAKYHESDKVLSQACDEKEEFIRYWIKYRHKLEWNHKADKNMLPQRLQHALIEFIALSAMNDFPSYREAQRSAVTLSDLAYEGWELTETNIESIIDYYENFKENARRFFKEYLNDAPATYAGNTLYRLGRWAKQVLIAHNQPVTLEKADKWNDEYRAAVWNSMQQAVNCICRLFHVPYGFPGDNIPLTLTHYTQVKTSQDMMENLKQAIASLPAATKNERNYLDLLEPGKKCIALLDSHNHSAKIAAFSGYFDIPADQVIYRKLQLRRTYINMFRTLCEELNWMLVVVTDTIAEQILYFEPEGTKTSLWDKINQCSEDFSFKGNYSCCERKILGYLDANGEFPDSMTFYIRKEPCFRCKPVMEDWWRNHPGVCAMTVDYIQENNQALWQPSRN